MKIVYDNGETNINRIPMAYACCDKCENPNRFAIGFVNEPLVNPWDEQEHKYCEKCGAFMDWKTVNIESQYKTFLAEHDSEIRAEVLEFISDKLIYPLLDECDRGLWEYIDHIELAEEWIKVLDDNPYPKVKNHTEARKRDLRQWIAEWLKEQNK